MSSESGSLSTKAAVVIIVVILLFGGIGGAIYYIYLIPNDEGEPIVIQGHVVDENGTAIANATVSFGSHHAVSNSTGHYSLDAYTRSDDRIVANETGHWTQERMAHFDNSTGPFQMNFTLTRNVKITVIFGIIYVTGDKNVMSVDIMIDSGEGTEVIVKDSKGEDSAVVSIGGIWYSCVISGSGTFSLCAILNATGIYSETPGVFSKAWPIYPALYTASFLNNLSDYLNINDTTNLESQTIHPDAGWSIGVGLSDGISVQPQQLWPRADVWILGEMTNVTFESLWHSRSVNGARNFVTYFTPKTIDGSLRNLNLFSGDGIPHLWLSDQLPNIGQNHTYQGKVTDEESKGLPNVSVRLGGHNTKTDNNGTFNLEAWDGDGTYFEAHKEGYWTQRFLNDPQSSISILNFTLAKNIECQIPVGGIYYHLTNGTKVASNVSYTPNDIEARVSGSDGDYLDVVLPPGTGASVIENPFSESPSSFLLTTSIYITGTYWRTPGEIESFSALLNNNASMAIIQSTDYMSIVGASNISQVTIGPEGESIAFDMNGTFEWPLALTPQVIIDILGKNTIIRPSIMMMAHEGIVGDVASTIQITIQTPDEIGNRNFSVYSENGFIIHIWETPI